MNTGSEPTISPYTGQIWFRGVVLAVTAFPCFVLVWWSCQWRPFVHTSSPAILLETVSQTKSDEFVSLGFGTVCRSSVQDFRTVPVEGEVRGGISKEKCQHLCSTDRTCAGFEFRRGERRCEIWRQEIFAHRHVFHNRTVPGAPDFECVLKLPSCQRLKAHKALHDHAIMDLAFFVTDYCEYGPINQDLDPCSRVYAEQMYDINHHLCRLVTKECKSATCESNSEII
ncbi:unnamed protein product [Cladocopium goreaui]|uniref:Apple domain-containing protein n=1 Tax=Cladocopium goreaui TaxID=2562237 RepID=A0A9P1CQ50_9DINO|nr:unnamed protein product [Cladocopium goreaui]